MNKIDKQLNLMLSYAKTCNLTDEELSEISKIGFLYSVGRMSPLEVALRMWYLCCHNVDGIYESSFQHYMDETCRKVIN